MKHHIALLALAIGGVLGTVSAQPQIALPKAPPQINPNILKAPLPGLQKPDLSVMDIKLRMLGAIPYAYVCVKNGGTANSGAFDVEVTMMQGAPSGSPPISWAVLVGTMRYPNVMPGGFACNDFRLPGNSVPACVKVSARADSRNEVAESNETNNRREEMSPCLGEPPGGASRPRLTLPDPKK
jgi:CARDB